MNRPHEGRSENLDLIHIRIQKVVVTRTEAHWEVLPHQFLLHDRPLGLVVPRSSLSFYFPAKFVGESLSPCTKGSQ